MAVRITIAEYRGSASYAGEWLARERPALLPVGSTTDVACGIYLICTPCPRTGAPLVNYVGKADRRKRAGDVSERLAEHRRTPKAPLMRWVAIVPLRDCTPPDEVARIEGDIARYFGVPRLCRSVPGGRRRRA
jgi:hypothetical protein